MKALEGGAGEEEGASSWLASFSSDVPSAATSADEACVGGRS